MLPLVKSWKLSNNHYFVFCLRCFRRQSASTRCILDSKLYAHHDPRTTYGSLWSIGGRQIRRIKRKEKRNDDFGGQNRYLGHTRSGDSLLFTSDIIRSFDNWLICMAYF